MSRYVNRRQFLATAAAATTGVVGASSRVAKASVPESRYTTDSICVRQSPGGAATALRTASTGGYVVDGPASSGGSTWWKLSFNESGDNDYSHCMGGTGGTVTGWVRAGVLATADFAYPVSGMVFREWREYEYEMLDITADAGQSVYAAENGTVVTVESDEDSWYGRNVVVDHGSGWTTRYGHLRDLFVSEGQLVTRGDEIGTVGSTGDGSHPYVAFQIRRDGVSWPIPGNRGRRLLATTGVPRSYP